MAAAPAYAPTPVLWCGLIPGTADTSWTAPTHVTALGTAGTAGTKIVQIDVIPAGGTVVAGLVNIFAYDGTTYQPAVLATTDGTHHHLHESVTIAAGTISTTAAPVKQTYYYDNLVLPSSSWALTVTGTVSSNAGLVEVNAFGASL